MQLFYFIKHKYLFYFIAGLVSCALNAELYFIAAFILFYCT